jgi:hypothetical protein
MLSTELSRARRFQAALALHPLPASKVQCGPPQFAGIDMHNTQACLGHYRRLSLCSLPVPKQSRGKPQEIHSPSLSRQRQDLAACALCNLVSLTKGG